jgi:hypothetical protein
MGYEVSVQKKNSIGLLESLLEDNTQSQKTEGGKND